MAPRLSGYFCGPQLYPHNSIDPDPDDICIVCRESFSDEPAIRLTSCSHIVGADCFRNWVRHHPHTCPYWNHSLPPSTSSTSRLEAACNQKWFKKYEELVHMLMANDKGAHKFIAALDALHGDRLSLRDFKTILWYFGAKAVFASAVLVMVPFICIGIASTLLWAATAVPTMLPSANELRAWVPFATLLKFLMIVYLLLVSLGVVAVVTFITIVFSVLVLSMWRSFPQSWVGKQVGVPAWRKSTNQKNE